MMRTRVAIVVAVLLGGCQIPSFCQQAGPFSLDKLLSCLNDPYISTRALVQAIEVRGIGFLVTEETIARLQQAGADSRVLEAVRKAGEEFRKRAYGEIQIRSIPVGATVWIDGKEVGATPFADELPVGRKHVRVGGVQGYKEYQCEVDVEPGRSKLVEVSLLRLLKLKIFTDPSGADVSVHTETGEPVGRGTTSQETPVTIDGLALGVVVVRIVKECYRPIEERVFLAKDRELRYMLQEQKGWLKIATQPKNAAIYIDGIERGSSPLSLGLCPGSYTIVARKPPKFRDVALPISLKPNDTASVELKLEPVVEAPLPPGEPDWLHVGGRGSLYRSFRPSNTKTHYYVPMTVFWGWNTRIGILRFLELECEAGRFNTPVTVSYYDLLTETIGQLTGTQTILGIVFKQPRRPGRIIRTSLSLGLIHLRCHNFRLTGEVWANPRGDYYYRLEALELRHGTGCYLGVGFDLFLGRRVALTVENKFTFGSLRMKSKATLEGYGEVEGPTVNAWDSVNSVGVELSLF